MGTRSQEKEDYALLNSIIRHCDAQKLYGQSLTLRLEATYGDIVGKSESGGTHPARYQAMVSALGVKHENC